MMDQALSTVLLRIPGYRHIQNPELIGWLKGSGNYTLVYLKGSRRPLMVSQTLKYFELYLTGFIRASKSSVVNPTYIRAVIKENTQTMYLTLIDGTTIVVPRRRILDTLARLASTPVQRA